MVSTRGSSGRSLFHWFPFGAFKASVSSLVAHETQFLLKAVCFCCVINNRTIRDAVNKRTAAYNEALLSGNMSVYKALCYALRRAVSAAKTSIQRENWVSFSAQWLSTHVAGTKDHLCLWKQILRGGESRSVAGRRVKHLLRPLWMQCKDCTICDSWGNSGSHHQSWKLSIQGP